MCENFEKKRQKRRQIIKKSTFWAQKYPIFPTVGPATAGVITQHVGIKLHLHTLLESFELSSATTRNNTNTEDCRDDTGKLPLGCTTIYCLKNGDRRELQLFYSNLDRGSTAVFMHELC